MLIQDLVVIRNHGILLLVAPSDPEFASIDIGSKLQQGTTIWEVVGLERQGSKATGGVLVKPAAPIPERGDITVLP